MVLREGALKSGPAQGSLDSVSEVRGVFRNRDLFRGNSNRLCVWGFAWTVLANNSKCLMSGIEVFVWWSLTLGGLDF